MASFDYLVTIHNKEALLPRTLAGIGAAAGPEAGIIAVLDGCTDRSEEVVDAFARESDLRVRKVHTPDVHEILSINAGLEVARGDFVVSLQDDVILQAPDFEARLEQLYQAEGPSLGVVSLRLAANLRPATLGERLRMAARHGPKGFSNMITECDHVGHPHETTPADRVPYGTFVQRMVAIKSPVVMPRSVLSKVGFLDANLAPYSYCDHEYGLRSMRAGFRNGLFPLPFRSDLEWGGTRTDTTFVRESGPIHVRNRRYIWKKHGSFMRRLRDSRRPATASPRRLSANGP